MQIVPAESLERQLAALRKLVIDPQQRVAIERELVARSADARAMLVAVDDQKLVGVAWAQIFPGRVALMWPVAVVDAVPSAAACSPSTGDPHSSEPPRGAYRPAEVAAALLSAAESVARRCGVQLLQALLPPDAIVPARQLESSGFHHVADLVYLGTTPRVLAQTRGDLERLVLRPASEVSADRLASVVEQTYVGTLDCPALNGMRAISDILEGYRGTGRSGDRYWWLASHGGEDAGCLFLADHAGQDQFELVYVGVVPSQRGQQWGSQLTRFAIEQTRLAGRQRLVLAVDADNRPALEMYLSLGLIPLESQRAYLKQLEPGPAGP